MTSKFELWNNLHRAMTPLAHWYALIDNEVILELQKKSYTRYCTTDIALLNEHISDEDIEEYPETFMPRLCIMPTGLQGPAQPQQPDTAHVSPCCNTEQT